MKSLGYITEIILFDTDIDTELWNKNHEKLSNDLLNIRLLKESLTFSKDSYYLNPDLYYGVNNVDTSHGSFEIELPSVTEETNLKEFFKIRNKLINRAKSLIKKHFKNI